MDPTLGIRLRVETQAARARRGNARGTAVACEVSLCEYLDEGVLSMALDGARVADTGGFEGTVGRGRRGVASQTGEHVLAECAERFGAVLNAL